MTQRQTKAQLTTAIEELGGAERIAAGMKRDDLAALRDTIILEVQAAECEADAQGGGPHLAIGDLRNAQPGDSDVAMGDPVEDGPGTALEVLEQPDGLPTFSRWQQMEQMSERLAASKLLPGPLRGKPADVLLILLSAHDLGITATQGLQKLHVIEGKVGMAAELMVALVLAAGHDIRPDTDNDDQSATAIGRRMGSDHEGRFTFTMDDARRARLADRGPWQSYPRAMLWARAVSGLCRQMFPDCLVGVSYTPEELGAIEVEGTEVQRPVLEPEAGPAGEPAVAAITKRLGELTDEQRDCVRTRWAAEQEAKRLHSLKALRANEVGTVLRLIADCLHAWPPDAEIVEPGAHLDGEAAANAAELVAEQLGGTPVATCTWCEQPAVDAGLCADHAPM